MPEGRGFAYSFGRFLQLMGLVMLPVGLYQGVVHDRGMTAELTLLGVGACCFLLGLALLRPYRE